MWVYYAILGVGLVGLTIRVIVLYKRAKYRRLHNALQAWVDAIVELYDSDDDEPTA